MDKTIVTAFLIIAGVVSAVLVFNTIYPAAMQSGDALTSRQRRIDERLRSQTEIIHATGKSDISDVFVWVKNVGSLRISAIESCDVFFGLEGSFARIPYNEGTPHWEYELENDSAWNPTATLKITIRYGTSDPPYPPAGRHFLKVTIPNGISDEYYFRIE